MDESSPTQNRKSRRSNVLMAASLELSGTSLAVKLRNLSSEGALIQGDALPVEGASVMFRKGELCVSGQVAWVKGRQAGIAFAEPLNPEQLLRHVPKPRPRVMPKYRRPGLRGGSLTAQERELGERWVWRLPPFND